jgi:tetratricopeptide (TPR) repeat protein
VWTTELVGRPERLVRDGNWRAARVAADRLEGSVLRGLPGVADAARYTRALCLHLEGDFEASLAGLATVRVTNKMRYALRTLEAANLVLLGRDAERAVAALQEACKIQQWPEDTLLLALALQSLGRREDAEDLFVRAGKERPKRAPSPKINDAVFHFLRALYLMRTERGGVAMADLKSAVRSPVSSAYVARARALLPPEPSPDDDPQSSLGGIAL